MQPSERKQKILGLLRDKGEISVQALADALEVPSTSVRRDLRELESENRIQRRHGRAIYRPTLVAAPVVVPDADLEESLLEELVDETVELLADARNLFLAGGPVVARVAAMLSQKTIATHDLAIAMAAATAGNDVVLIGREVDNPTLTLRSSNLDQELQSHFFDFVVLEVDGIDDQNLWVSRKNHGPLATLLERRSDALLAVVKSTVFHQKSDRVAGPLRRADVIVMDRGASDAQRQMVADNAEVHVTGSGDPRHVFAFDKVGNVFVFRKTPNRFGSAASNE